MDKEQKMRIDKVEYVGDRIIITGDELPILRTVIVDSIVGKVDLLHNNINYKAIELGKDLMDYFRQEEKIKIEKLKKENEELKTQLKKYTISEKEEDNTNKIETLNKLGNYNFYNLGFMCIEEMGELEVKLKRAIKKELEMQLKRQQLSGD